jgi:3',5'-cyclic AMP phosphodiesterase CpdA
MRSLLFAALALPAPLAWSAPDVYLTWQRDPTTTMTVCWQDGPGGPDQISWRPQSSDVWQTAGGSQQPLPHTDRTVSQIELTALAPDTTYEFRLGQEENIRRFRTLPATLDRPLTFVEGGDPQDGPAVGQMMRLAASLDPAFAVIGGDLTFDDGLPEHAGRVERFFRTLGKDLIASDGRHIPVIVCLGNHDVNRNEQWILNDDALPQDAAARRALAPYFLASWPFPGERGYGVLDIGDYLSLVLLDTNHLNAIDGPQLGWLRETLSARGKVTHLFPIYHIPAYPGVRDMRDEVSTLIREKWTPLFEQAGIRLAFEHHEHAFKVTHPLRGGNKSTDGIVYLGGGAMGIELRDPRDPANEPHLAKTAKVHHLHEVTIEPGQRTAVTRDINGTEIWRVEQEKQGAAGSRELGAKQ